MKTKIFKKICLAVISAIILIFVLEFGLRLCYVFFKNYQVEMWRYARELKTLSPVNNIGHEHRKNKRSNLCGVEVKINSQGLRADKEYIVPKPKNVKRILLLGDSITFGWGVAFADTYGQVLQRLLNQSSSGHYEVINAGVGNYNIHNEKAAMEKYLSLEPDVIVLGYYINDIEPIKYPSRFSYWARKNSIIFSLVFEKIVLLLRQKVNYVDYYKGLYADKKLTKAFEQTLMEMHDLAREKAIPFIFVNMPEFHSFRGYAFKEAHHYIQNTVLAREDIKYIDLLPSFKDQDPKSLWLSAYDVHPNKKGHHIIARRIYQKIMQLNREENNK